MYRGAVAGIGKKIQIEGLSDFEINEVLKKLPLKSFDIEAR